MRVLVVENERRLAAGLCNGLVAEGFAVEVALDSTDGLWLARERPAGSKPATCDWTRPPSRPGGARWRSCSPPASWPCWSSSSAAGGGRVQAGDPRPRLRRRLRGRSQHRRGLRASPAQQARPAVRAGRHPDGPREGHGPAGRGRRRPRHPPRRTASGSSSGSCVSPAPGPTAAAVSAWPSWPSWSPPTAARSASPPAPSGVPGSRSPFPGSPTRATDG
jgi:hypothetical protein